MPYKLIFGQRPRSAIVSGAPRKIINEGLGTIVKEPTSAPAPTNPTPTAIQEDCV